MRAARRRGAGEVIGVERDELAAIVARRAHPDCRVVTADLLDPELDLGEFDVVAGNPPYVRVHNLGIEARDGARRLFERLVPLPGSGLTELRGGDLAAWFVLRAVLLTRPGGRIGLVLSSALLDADYSRSLWALVQRYAVVDRIVVPCPGDHWFDAAVRPMVVILHRGAPARGARCTVLAHPVGGTAMRDAVTTDAGTDPRAWRVALRAPPLWHQVREACGDALVPLGSIARIDRGCESPANAVFYLSTQHAVGLGLEPELLVPVLRSPRELVSVQLVDAPLNVGLVVPRGTEMSRYPVTAAYLESQRAQVRPGKSWVLGARPGRVFLPRAHWRRHIVGLAREPVAVDQRFYVLHPRRCSDELLAAVLNTSLTALAIEVTARASMGEGALDLALSDAERLPVLDPSALDSAGGDRAALALAGMATRPVENIDAEVTRLDRLELDAAVAAAVPSLASLLGPIRDALVAQVAIRTARRRSRR